MVLVSAEVYKAAVDNYQNYASGADYYRGEAERCERSRDEWKALLDNLQVAENNQ